MKKSSNPVVAGLSGSIAGGIECAVVWPTEYTKTLLQLQKTVPGQPPMYKNMLDCATKNIRANGPLSLYSGLTAALLFAVPKAGVRFGGYQTISNLIIPFTDGKKTPLTNLAAGMSAGAIEATLVTTVQETIKTKLIESNQSLTAGVRSIVREGGVRALYNGLVPTIVKQSSNQGLRFMAFGMYSKFMTGGDPSAHLTFFQSMLGGMFSGCFSTLCNNPVDFVKTRMQGLQASEYKGTMDCVMTTFRTEGPLAFYKGVFPRLMRVVPGQGVLFGTYGTISAAVSKVVEG